MTMAGVLNPGVRSTLPLAPVMPAAEPAPQRGADFASVLAATGRVPDREAVLRDAAQKLVSTALVQPLFDALEEPSFGLTGPLAPGTGERRFAPMLHQHLADRVTNASQFPLVDLIVERFQSLMNKAGRDGPAGARS